MDLFSFFDYVHAKMDFARDNVVFWLVQALLEKKIGREKDAAGNSETRWQMPSALL
jgi:hypothetical protein